VWACHAVIVLNVLIALARSGSALGWFTFPATFTFPAKAILTSHSFHMACGNSSLLRAVEVVENLFLFTLRAVEPFSKERLVHLITVVAN
jgi:hypothetical protein